MDLRKLHFEPPVFDKNNIYRERQQSMNCAIHAFNNAVQSRVLTQEMCQAQVEESIERAKLSRESDIRAQAAKGKKSKRLKPWTPEDSIYYRNQLSTGGTRFSVEVVADAARPLGYIIIPLPPNDSPFNRIGSFYMQGKVHSGKGGGFFYHAVAVVNNYFIDSLPTKKILYGGMPWYFEPERKYQILKLEDITSPYVGPIVGGYMGERPAEDFEVMVLDDAYPAWRKLPEDYLQPVDIKQTPAIIEDIEYTSMPPPLEPVVVQQSKPTVGKTIVNYFEPPILQPIEDFEYEGNMEVLIEDDQNQIISTPKYDPPHKKMPRKIPKYEFPADPSYQGLSKKEGAKKRTRSMFAGIGGVPPLKLAASKTRVRSTGSGGNTWVNHVKAWSASRGVSYACAVSMPDCKADYARKRGMPKVYTSELRPV